jgi:hypothetical protein
MRDESTMSARRLAPLCAIGGLFLAAACGGSARDDGSGGGGSGQGGSGADGAPYALQSLDEPCGPSGITARGVLDRTEREYMTSLKSLADGAMVGLVLGIAYESGPLVCHPPYSTGETGPSLSEQVEVQVDFTFKTDDGAFSEQFAAPLMGGIAPMATLSASLPADQIQGTFDPNLPDLYDVAVGFEAQFDHTSTTGSVSTGGKKSETVGQGGLVATWSLMP